jgi:hypothetical protein
MPKKPNYNFEKRQKELAREQKREAKRREKNERKQAKESEASQQLPLPSPDALPT